MHLSGVGHVLGHVRFLAWDNAVAATWADITGTTALGLTTAAPRLRTCSVLAELGGSANRRAGQHVTEELRDKPCCGPLLHTSSVFLRNNSTCEKKGNLVCRGEEVYTRLLTLRRKSGDARAPPCRQHMSPEPLPQLQQANCGLFQGPTHSWVKLSFIQRFFSMTLRVGPAHVWASGSRRNGAACGRHLRPLHGGTRTHILPAK